ncbi:MULTISPECIES: hypothetical protein [Streptomyces]|uniref:hypothetical protein n=1 Tax=Streptomyces TaxID=1883 RepID=UPI000A7FBD30|nr:MULTISPECIES: hypothetical protein [Streptomyces]
MNSGAPLGIGLWDLYLDVRGQGVSHISLPGMLVVRGRLIDNAACRPKPVALLAEGGSDSVREVPLLYAPDGSRTFTAACRSGNRDRDGGR